VSKAKEHEKVKFLYTNAYRAQNEVSESKAIAEDLSLGLIPLIETWYPKYK
jgi:hypothetical protein